MKINKKGRVRVPAAGSAAVRRGFGVLVLATMTAACGGGAGSPASPTAPGGGQSLPQEVMYTAIGASDAIGVGATIPCVPFAQCPDGTGYVPVLARQLGIGRSISVMNLGIPAAVLSPTVQALGIQHGRTIPANFIEGEMPFVPRNANVLTIFAGGNDVNAIGTAIERGAAGSDPSGYISNQIRAFGSDYGTLLRGIRERAPGARIAVANLPNFAGMPFTSGYSSQRKQVIRQLSVGFSTTVINALGQQGVIVVDLLCDSRAYDAGNYSSDGFHPNDRGYAFIAAELHSALTSGGYPAPRSSCAQMN